MMTPQDDNDDDDKTGKSLPPLLACCSDLVRPNGVIVGTEIAKKTRESYPTLLSCIPTETPNVGPCFLGSLDGRLPLTHVQAQEFIADFGSVLHSLGITKGHRVALVLPNGPELALAILAVSQWAACVPLSATGAVMELKADLERCGPSLIIGPYSHGPLPTATPMEQHEAHEQDETCSELAETYNVLSNTSRDWTVHSHVEEVAKELAIGYCGLVPHPTRAGPFKLVVHKSKKKKDAPPPNLNYDKLPSVPHQQGVSLSVDTSPNSAHDEALVLFTSGTTGNKKLVPHQIGDLLTAATVIALSWKLVPPDVNCNLMPLFHVGGIVRQVFSPLVSGSTVICCPSFDADLFWALLNKKAFNWYYAAPTMHQIILATSNGSSGKLKMIANAAGGLLPSLALEMRRTFGASILPSYGMTECMPISSPPAHYNLDKPGTSGVPVGPEVAILNLATIASLPPMEEGPICVRGEPCFRGYGVLANDPTAAKPASFLKDGWFNTGDLGYLDEDGYLYITGRSKEVINRGGEIIAPMEVEEAVLSHPAVKACAAFSVAHDVLQETVGIVVVTDGTRQLDLPTLQAHVAEKLAAPKWPQCLVFMNGLPKSHTNKLLRVKLGTRLGLPEMTDEQSTWARTFEATCPPQGTPLTDPIPSKLVSVDATQVQETLRQGMNHSKSIWVVPYPNRPGAVVAYVSKDVDRHELIDVAVQKLDRYAVPTHVCVVDSMPDASSGAMKRNVPNPKDAVASILNGGGGIVDPLVEQVQDMFVDLLTLDYIPTPDTDFFHVGGSSMRASQLAGKVRKTFRVGCSGAEVFHHSTPATLAGLVKVRQEEAGKGGDDKQASGGLDPHAGRDVQSARFSSRQLEPKSCVMGYIVQLLPMFVVFPAWQIARYLMFFTLLLEKSRFFWDITDRDIVTFLLAFMVFHLLWVTFVPLVFVLIKWIVIGRYEPGRYPIWGSYYLRWWFVDVCRKLFLRGIWGSNDYMLNFYYRMLGADIAHGAKISLECDVAEYDLVSVGRNAAVEMCTLRGFAVDKGAMMLGPVRVGHDSSVGLRSVVAPYTQVPDGQHLGPVTSSYDVSPGKALSEKHARTNRRCFAEPSVAMQLFVGGPITFVVNAFAQIPPVIVLYLLLLYKSREHGENFFSNWNELLDWMCDPARIPFFIGIRLARALLSPFFYIFAAIVTKKLVIGTIKPGPRNTRDKWENFRHWLAATLFTRKKIQSCTDLIGRHYEYVSILYRLLGAKVGKRVFWPGHQLVTTGTFDLLEIGDDCVFGSRSALICSTVDRCEKIILCAGANVADNCVVMAGTVVGKNAVLGSNSISPEGMLLPAGSVWFGSNGCAPTCLEEGDGSDADQYQSLNEETTDGVPLHASCTSDKLPLEGDESTLRPFGKAVYMGMAKGYRVWSIPSIVAFTLANRVFQIVFHLLPILGAIQFGSVLLYTDHGLKQMWRNSMFGSLNYVYDDDEDEDVNHDKFLWWERDFDNDGHHHTFAQVYFAILVCFLGTHFLRVFGWLAIELGAKWCIMGRRQPGRYNYDTSDYAQRWEIYQLTAKIRKLSRLNLLQFIMGTPYMNWYFRWNGGQIGKNCCLYPAGADPFMPEPDLVTLGDRTVVDCASIVAHLNTRGNFELVPITVEEDCTLRTRSRIQQGVHMETGSMILEKSLAMTGEIIDALTVWQGGPATMWFRYPDPDVEEYKPPEDPVKGGSLKETEMKAIPDGSAET